jgi:DNA-binding NtrC family response regulator
VNWLVNKFSKKLGKRIEKVPQKIMRSLQGYHWPGNVRELENVIERAVINSQGSVLTLAETFGSPDTADLASGRPKSLSEIERDHILQTLEETNWRVSGAKGAAALLGINPNTLRGRMRKHGIRRF